MEIYAVNASSLFFFLFLCKNNKLISSPIKKIQVAYENLILKSSK